MTKKEKHMKKGAGHHISYKQEIEEELITWVLRQRDLQIPVRRQDYYLRQPRLQSLQWMDRQIHVTPWPIT